MKLQIKKEPSLLPLPTTPTYHNLLRIWEFFISRRHQNGTNTAKNHRNGREGRHNSGKEVLTSLLQVLDVLFLLFFVVFFGEAVLRGGGG